MKFWAIKQNAHNILWSTIYCALNIARKKIDLQIILSRYLEVSSINVASHLTEDIFALAITQVAEEVEEIEQPVSVLDESATGENVRKMISSLIFT